MGQPIVPPSWEGRTFAPLAKGHRVYPCAFTIRTVGSYTFRVEWADGKKVPPRKETMSIALFLLHKDKAFREVH